jgi:sulfur relay protein TusB/DsrH
MKLAVFVNEYGRPETTLERLKAEKLGVILVGNGIYHAVIKENGQTSSVLSKEGADFCVLSEDLETRGFSAGDVVDSKVAVINYDQLADIVMNDYEKLAWL